MKHFSEREFSELYLAWCNDSRQRVKSTQNVVTFKQILSKSTKTKLILQSSRIGVNTAIAISRLFFDNSLLQKIDLHENVIRDNGCSAIVELFKSKMCQIRILNIGSNDIGVAGIMPLCNLLKKKECPIESLILGSEEKELYTNKIDHVTGYELAKSLNDNEKLEILDLNRNVLLGKKSQKAFREFAKTFKRNKTIKSLRLGSTSMSTNSAVLLLNSLSNHYNLHYLDIHGNDLGSDIANSLSQLISNEKCLLSTLLLHRNNLGLRGIKILCKALKTNTSICVLNISNNKIGEEHQINQNKTKEILRLPSLAVNNKKLINQKISSKLFEEEEVISIDLGAREVASLISENKTITYLNLKTNGFRVEGCKNIAEALHQNKVISHLILSNNKFYDDGIISLGKAIEKHPTLKKLEIGSTCIGDRGAVSFIMNLSVNKSLTMVKMQNNHISEDSGKVLVEILKNNFILTVIDIRGNQIDHSTVLGVKKFLKRNKSRRISAEPKNLEKELIRLKYADYLLRVAQQFYKKKMHEKEKVMSDLYLLEDQINSDRETNTIHNDEKKQRIKSENDQSQKIMEEIKDKEEELKVFTLKYEKQGKLKKLNLGKQLRLREEKDTEMKRLMEEIESYTVNSEVKTEEIEDNFKQIISEIDLTKKVRDKTRIEVEKTNHAIDDLILTFGDQKYRILSLFEKKMEEIEKENSQKKLDEDNLKLADEQERIDKQKEEDEKREKEREEEEILIKELEEVEKLEKERKKKKKENQEKMIENEDGGSEKKDTEKTI